MTTKKRRRVALNLNGRGIEYLGRFLLNAGIAHELGANGRVFAAYANPEPTRPASESVPATGGDGLGSGGVVGCEPSNGDNNHA